MHSVLHSTLLNYFTAPAPKSYSILVGLGAGTGRGLLRPLRSATIAGVLPLKS
ncbi:hypothetical protein [Rickettsia rhipicephali]|uniref:hypothetical protein n=1 Tax=Rickettsia rhipicephali TaxID=33992 RepID=UPI000308CD5C|nr:hypothetical protein [Rickettsia rhipicephali]